MGGRRDFGRIAGTAAILALLGRPGMAETPTGDGSPGGAMPGGATPGAAPPADIAAKLAVQFGKIERASGGRLGVAIADMGNGAIYGHRAASRFALSDSAKILIVGAILARCDAGKERLARVVPVASKDLVTESAALRRLLGGGAGLSVGALCEAALVHGDNTASNLLLVSVGGPSGVTAFVRKLGDTATSIDHAEPVPEGDGGHGADGTVPAAMLSDLLGLCYGDRLAEESRGLLRSWMGDCETGNGLIRAGLPSGWRFAHKSGTATGGVSVDVGIAQPPAGPPILVAAFLDGATRRMGSGGGLRAVGKVVASLRAG